MSIFNKNALSNFFGLSGEDEYDDSYESYSEQSAVNEQPRQQPRVRQQPRAQQTVPQQQTVQQQTYQQSGSEPLRERPSARYRSTEKHQNPTSGSHQTRSYNEKKVVSMRNSNTSSVPRESNRYDEPMKISIIEPRVYSEAMNIAKHIIVEEAVLINFHLIEEGQARRIVDFLTGTVYALDGDIQRVGDEIFLCTPPNMEIDSATAQSLAKKQMFDF
ncbi:cell division protein SepF [Enterococcus sp. BWM-S5]|uniref:Cell division protein SepF n=1 Tax=Enterococcus larvae TaxID=2794352 RepID=A0ABS4CGI4_9ENTE|nr:cell division protein SepF [Enterococcus larvae]MBP1045387.1 cell division protein SepF [Enterococcus larvae]